MHAIESAVGREVARLGGTLFRRRGRDVRPASLARRGELLFLVDLDRLDAVIEWRRPTPIPGADSAVAGVFFHGGSPCLAVDPALAFGAEAPGDPRYWLLVRREHQRWALALDEMRAEVPVSRLVENNPLHRVEVLAGRPVGRGPEIAWWLELEPAGGRR